jgi:hypothetical protein
VPTEPGALAGRFALVSTAADEADLPIFGKQVAGGMTTYMLERAWDGAAYTATADPCRVTNFEVAGLVTTVEENATRAGVVLYSLDTRGLVAEPPGGAASFQGPGVLRAPGARASLQARSVEALRQGLNALAADTGGFLVKNSNDLDQGLGRILRDNETYYLLAYEPTNTARDGRFRKIQVRLRAARAQGGPAAGTSRRRGTRRRAPTWIRPGRAASARSPGARLALPLPDVPLRLAADFIALPPQAPRRSSRSTST